MHAAIRSLAMATALALAVAACGPSGGDDQPSATAGGDLNALVASYDLVVDRPGRFLVGLLDNQQRGVAYGTVSLDFAYAGTREQPLEPPRPGPSANADFRPIPGQDLDADAGGPRLVSPSEVIGVYGAPEVGFETAGFWEVTANAVLDGEPTEASATFEVLADSTIPTVGDPAPRTEQPLAGDSTVPAREVDSRAEPVPGAPVPDPELHSTTVAAAVAAGRPIMVVVSTPTYCVSRFCGPITDSVSALAGRFGEQMDFAHLEVWQDFESQALNPAAEEWILPPGAEGKEPWVFVVDQGGIIVERFDNVATEAELERAVTEVLA